MMPHLRPCPAGWIREMYAWDIALAQAHVKMITEDPPRSPLISQPPSDRTLGNASMFHYTVREGDDG